MCSSCDFSLFPNFVGDFNYDLSKSSRWFQQKDQTNLVKIRGTNNKKAHGYFHLQNSVLKTYALQHIHCLHAYIAILYNNSLKSIYIYLYNIRTVSSKSDIWAPQLFDPLELPGRGNGVMEKDRLRSCKIDSLDVLVCHKNFYFYMFYVSVFSIKFHVNKQFCLAKTHLEQLHCS